MLSDDACHLHICCHENRSSCQILCDFVEIIVTLLKRRKMNYCKCWVLRQNNFQRGATAQHICALQCLNLCNNIYWFQKQVTVPRDNCPSSPYVYLVAVYTGYRRNAGTTSNVGIQLVGDKNRCLVRYIKSH
jgi:hypothetical protein